MRTAINRFGLLRDYPHRPSYDPDSSLAIEDLAVLPKQPSAIECSSGQPPPPWPFTSMTVYLVMEWMITGGNQKSEGEINRLVKGVLSHPSFNPQELVGFSARKETQRLDKVPMAEMPNSPFSSDEWISSDVRIRIPAGKNESKVFAVPGLYRRPLVPVMRAALADSSAARFHLSPFKRVWCSPSGVEQRCFDELYTSDAFLDSHNGLQKQKNEPGCKLEKVVLGLMLWSDSTHLANFGTAKVWPIYMYFANLSKYVRAKPTSGASHHVAYIPSVSVSRFFLYLNKLYSFSPAS